VVTLCTSCCNIQKFCSFPVHCVYFIRFILFSISTRIFSLRQSRLKQAAVSVVWELNTYVKFRWIYVFRELYSLLVIGF